ncbi:MAG: hypothetical protein VX620_15550 [Pseudomonadota bacterium]|nr:hypothetical protein [Pseudomonadota bacterium]
MAKKAKGAAKAAPTIRVARLAPDGILSGFDEVPAGSVAAVTDGMPEWVDGGDCDLKPGRYRWNPQLGRFDAVKRMKVEAETAIIDMFKAIRDQAGIDMPASTAQWISDFDKRKERAGQ